MNDLTITLNPTVTVVLRGGATKTLTCTMNVKIEADRMRGRASATLDLGTGYTDYSVTDYEATSPARHQRTEWSNTPYDNFQTDKKRHEKTTNIHYGGFAVGGFVGAPAGCGADLRRKGQRLAVCSATLNAGAEAALTDNWSLELSGYWNPVKTASLSMNFHAVQLGGRYWFYESFVGHFLGQHLPMSVTTSEAGQNAIRGMPAVWVSATGMRGCSRNDGISPSSRHRAVPYRRHTPRPDRL